MEKLTVVKFGGSAIGIDGQGLPTIIDRIKHLRSDSKIVTVCSAPLTTADNEKSSLTDVILNLGENAANGIDTSMEIIVNSYSKILEMVGDEHKLSLIHI